MWHYIHESTLWYVCGGIFHVDFSADNIFVWYGNANVFLMLSFAVCGFSKCIYFLLTETLHSLLLCACWCRITKVVDKSKKISDVPQWFEGCRLNYAENLLRHRDDRVAIYGLREYVCSQSVLWSVKTADAFITMPNRFECRYSAGCFWCIFGSMLVCFCIVG